jgi:hypothetical protein
MAIWLLAGMIPLSSQAQPLPPTLKQVLGTNLQFSAQEIQEAEAGQGVVRLVDTGNPEDVFVAGIIRLAVPPAYFVQRYRDIVKFESGPGILAVGKFSNPPREDDMAGLVFSKAEVDDLRDCEPGDCDFKIGDRGMKFIRDGVQWSSADYLQQLNRVIREMWIRYLKEYQEKGNAALAAYHDTDKIFHVEQGQGELLAKSPFLTRYLPELSGYLTGYPKAALPNGEDFFYWQVADFGLKPVHRITHVAIQRAESKEGEAYAIASKMLWASHYFRSALEFRVLVPVKTGDGKPAHYFVVLQRSYVDGLTGFKGRLIRGPIMSRTVSSMKGYLSNTKTRLEEGYAQETGKKGS